MRIDVALLPSLLPEPPGAVCIIVDVLRASSSCATLLDAGAESIAVAADVNKARALHDLAPAGTLLCGEVGGLPPEGFDYGNSPVEFSAIELSGRRVIDGHAATARGHSRGSRLHRPSGRLPS